MDIKKHLEDRGFKEITSSIFYYQFSFNYTDFNDCDNDKLYLGCTNDKTLIYFKNCPNDYRIEIFIEDPMKFNKNYISVKVDQGSETIFYQKIILTNFYDMNNVLKYISQNYGI